MMSLKKISTIEYYKKLTNAFTRREEARLFFSASNGRAGDAGRYKHPATIVK